MSAAENSRLSIGLAVYNGADHLAATLDSILSQTFGDYELLISDNASTDGTEDICRQYAAKDPRIRYTRARVNRGASWNYRRVFERTSAPYFKWAADDDLLAPEFLERCIQALDAHPDAVVAYTLAQHIDSNGVVVQHPNSPLRHFEWSDRPSERFRQLLEVFGEDGGASAPMLHHGIIRRKPLAETRLMGPYFAADIVLLAELMLRGTFVEVPEILFSIRLHPGSSSWPETWSAESIHDHFDPRPRARVSLTFSMRRHYLEYPLAVVRSPLKAREKAELLAFCATPPLRQMKRKVSALTRRQANPESNRTT